MYLKVSASEAYAGNEFDIFILAITGQSLVQIIQEGLREEDSDTQQAGHLATILLHYGYIFPVIEQVQQVSIRPRTLYISNRALFRLGMTAPCIGCNSLTSGHRIISPLTTWNIVSSPPLLSI